MFPSVESLNRHVLTIRHSTDGFSYVIYKLDDKQFTSLCIGHEPDISLKEAVSKIEIENNCDISNFNKVKVIIDNNRNTFVPNEVYQESNKNQYLGVLGIANEELVVCSDNLSKAGMYNVYAIAKADYEMLTTGDFEFYHASSVLASSLIADNTERPDDLRVYLNIKNRCFEMMVMKGVEILFNNSFRFKTKEDFLYFLLFAMEQLHLDTETVPVYFLGMIEEKAQLVELTARYVRNIRFVKRDNAINLAAELEETPFYYHYILYKSIKCEL